MSTRTPVPPGNLKGGDAPGRGHKGFGILGIDAAFDAVAAKLDRPDGVFQLFARGDANLGLDQVHAGDHLGHGMLHLNARVHLDEVERAVLIHQKFTVPALLVADLLQGLDHLLPSFVAALRGQRRRRRLLHQFLVTPLDAALALAQMHHVAVADRQAPEIRCAAAAR